MSARRRRGPGLVAALAAASGAALAATPARAAAQGAAGSVVVGTVVSDSSNAPLAGAEVVVEALRRSARAGDDGAFTLRGLPAGVHLLTVRGVGYDPLVARVRATGVAGDTIAADFALARRTVTLAGVSVRSSARPREEERTRTREHGGMFVGREILERHEQSTMSEVFRRVPGINVQRIITPRGAITTLASSRGGAPGSLLRQGSKYCYYQIYVDGVRIYSPEMGEPPDLDTFRPADYDGVEVYRGPAETPQQYSGTGASCGTVVFRSRTR